MRVPFFVALVMVLGLGALTGSSSRPRVDEATRRVVVGYGRLLLTFEPNLGQADPAARFLSRGRGYTLFLTATEAILSVTAAKNDSSRDMRSSPAVLRMQLVGANPEARVEGLHPLASRSNYFMSNDRTKWRTDIPHYGRVRYQGTYPGIDLVFYGDEEGRLEYDFVVAPRADPRIIELAFAGLDRLELDSDGDLVLRVPAPGTEGAAGDEGIVRLYRPRIYQETEGRRQQIAGRYVLRGPRAAHRVGFEVGPYDCTKPLVIDPVLSYSTYLPSNPTSRAIAVDVDGAVYVMGSAGDGGCAMNADGSSYVECSSSFVFKFAPGGTALVYSSFFGTRFEGSDVAGDALGNAYVTGTTDSETFPTTDGAVDTTCNCLIFEYTDNGWYHYFSPEAFVMKLDPTGSLVYSTLLGGTGAEHGHSIALDAAGNVYIAGDTASTDFPTAHSFQNGLAGIQDAFVAALNPTGTALLYSTYLGGSGVERGSGIAVDATGTAFMTGHTTSSDFPISNPIQARFGGGAGPGDAFVTRLDPTGSALVYSTYLGGSAADTASAIALDPLGNAYVTGHTSSPDFPLASAYQSAPGATDAPDVFVSRLSAAGTALDYSTYLGGSGSDQGLGIAVDAAGSAYVTGRTESVNFPVANAFQVGFSARPGVPDAFVTRLTPAGDALMYSTLLGGDASDVGLSVTLDPTGKAYVTGSSESADFLVTPGAAKGFRSLEWNPEAFVAEIVEAEGARVAFGPGVVLFPEQAVGTTSAPRTVRLAAVGTEPLEIGYVVYPNCPEIGACEAGYWESYTISVTGDFRLSALDCPLSLYPGSSCTLAVTFTPGAGGTRTGAITIADNAPGSPHVISLRGTGIPSPVLELVPNGLDFGSQLRGTTSAPQTVNVRNVGTGDLTLYSIDASGDFAQTNTCNAPVPPGGTCIISVIFAPRGIGGISGAIAIRDNTPAGTHGIALAGTGVAPAVNFSPSGLTFGGQPVGTTGPAQIITLISIGSAALNLSSIVFSGEFAQTNDCVSPIAPGATCTITVTFSPTATGPRNGTITVTDDAPGSPHVMYLSGTGTGAEPAVAIAPVSLTFGKQVVGPTSAAKPLRLRNTGTATLTISSIAATGDFSQTHTCGSALAAGASCVISVRFTARATGMR